jgi:hypothetical protein
MRKRTAFGQYKVPLRLFTNHALTTSPSEAGYA